MFISIKTKIFLPHLFLVVVLLGGLSYKHYLNSVDNYLNNIITYYTNYSSSIVSTSSLAISGANYGNIQLPSFIEEVSRNKKLLYLKITGLSDNTSKKFNAVYNKRHQTIYRNEYPVNHEKVLKSKLQRFTSKIGNESSDQMKIKFLIDRTDDKLKQYYQNIQYSKDIDKKFINILNKKSSFIDFYNNLLYLSFKTSNKNSGKVAMIFNISEVKEIKSKILQDLLIEAFIALLLSIIVLMVVSSKIIDPLKKLSNYLSNDFQSLNVDNTPGLKLNDEIGILSNTFKGLLRTVQEEQLKTEKKAYVDGLTNVYNRNKFDEVLKEELLRSQRYEHPLSMAIIDIDNFKNFNDIYGHLIGDEVLSSMAQVIDKNTRNTDIFARWGGEEFVLLLKETDIKATKEIALKLKDIIQNNTHPIAGNITASFGLTQYQKGDTAASIFKRCDKALYIAKNNGRNRVEIIYNIKIFK